LKLLLRFLIGIWLGPIFGRTIIKIGGAFNSKIGNPIKWKDYLHSPTFWLEGIKANNNQTKLPKKEKKGSRFSTQFF
jgi:hypothetical protein